MPPENEDKNNNFNGAAVVSDDQNVSDKGSQHEQLKMSREHEQLPENGEVAMRLG